MRQYTVGMAALVLAMLLGSAGGGRGQGKSASDKDKLQGTWTIQSLEFGGKKFGGDDLKKMKMDKKMVVSGDKIYPMGEQDKEESTFVLDAGKTPKQMDLTDTKGEKKGKKTAAIYTFDGNDTLKLAFALGEGADRPTEFTAKEKTPVAVMVLKREKK